MTFITKIESEVECKLKLERNERKFPMIPISAPLKELGITD